MSAGRLATFTVRGKTRYGAITEKGAVDVSARHAEWPTLREVIEAGARPDSPKRPKASLPISGSTPSPTTKSAPLIISKGKWVFVEDIDGRSYLDAVGGLWNVNIGHGRDEIKHAIVDQLDRIAYYTTFGTTSNAPQIELSVRLSELLLPKRWTRYCFRRVVRTRSRRLSNWRDSIID